MQSPSLDIAPTDFGWAREETFSGRFVFVVQGDPSVTVPMWEGMAWLKKDIVPAREQGVVQYDLHGDIVTVPAITLPALMRDVGVQQFSRMRISGRWCEGILAELPGPVAREIMCDMMPKEVVAHLAQWYTMALTSLRRNPIHQELIGTFTLREAR